MQGKAGMRQCNSRFPQRMKRSETAFLTPAPSPSLPSFSTPIPATHMSARKRLKRSTFRPDKGSPRRRRAWGGDRGAGEERGEDETLCRVVSTELSVQKGVVYQISSSPSVLRPNPPLNFRVSGYLQAMLTAPTCLLRTAFHSHTSFRLPLSFVGIHLRP